MMPSTVRKRRKGEGGKAYKIVDKNTGKVIGQSDSKRKAAISAGFRDKGHKK
jgi:hypothetical protein